MTAEPVPIEPPWAKPGGHEDIPDFTYAKGTGTNLWPASPPLTTPADIPEANQSAGLGTNLSGDSDRHPT